MSALMHTKLLTPKQVSQILGIKESTLAAWRFHLRQPLNYCKIGSKIMYRESDVQAFIELRTNKITIQNNQSK